MDTTQWPTSRLLNTAARLSASRENERLRTLGTTPAGLLTLRALARTTPITQVELARELRVQAQTIGKLLERLETRGLITRTRSDDDRRVFIVSLTPAGESILQRARALQEEHTRASETSDAALREELIAHIRNLGGFPRAVDQRPNLRMISNDQPHDEPAGQELTVS